MCQVCKAFLRDFLEVQLPKDLPLSSQIQMKALNRVHSELADWMYTFYGRLSKEEFQTAQETASRIARRGRKQLDYEYLMLTAIFNFLKFSLDWIHPEVQYMSTLLLESGFVKSRQKQGDTNTAYNYISFMTPRVILILNDLHKDHMNPKGLMTDIPKLFQLSTIKQDDEDTLYDRDDNYQKEILDEVDLSDLYT